MSHLPDGELSTVELVTKLANEFALGPGQARIIE
jgi:hypothetical protein